MTDDAPTSVLLDHSLPQATDRLTGIYLAEFAETARIAHEAGDLLAPLPHLSPENLREWLRDRMPMAATASALETGLGACAIAQVSLDLIAAQTALDIALDRFLRGAGVISTSLYVNDPSAMEALEARPLPLLEDEALLVPVADFYPDPPLDDDGRCDVLLGVARWRGIYLCRPCLVDLTAIEERFAEADTISKAFLRPTVTYVPRFGAH